MRDDTATPPTLDDAADWLKVDPATVGLDDALRAALERQAAQCVVDPYTTSLRVAALRRTAREYTSRAFPLGIQDAGDFGIARVGRDYLIDELEADYRRGAFDTAAGA